MGDVSGAQELAIQGFAAYNDEKDYPKAVELWTIAANAGDAVSQYNLGICYLTGTGIEQDVYKAIHWLGESAAQGYEPAVETYNGLKKEADSGKDDDEELVIIAGNKNLKEAVDLYNAERYADAAPLLADLAEQGHTMAQFFYGMCLLRCMNSEEDSEKAVCWLQKSADSGCAEAREYLEKLREVRSRNGKYNTL